MTRRLTGPLKVIDDWNRAHRVLQPTVEQIEAPLFEDLRLDIPPDPPRPPVFGVDFTERLNRDLIVAEEPS